MKNKMLWEITGTSNGKKLSAMYVKADSFCEAVKIAKEKNPDYCCGRVVATNFSEKEIADNND